MLKPDATTQPAIQQQVGGEHYKAMAIQPVEFALVNHLNTAQANIVKYLLRDKADDDIDKAIHYIDLWLEITERYRLRQLARPLAIRSSLGLPVITVDAFAKANHLSEDITTILHLVVTEPNERSLLAARSLMGVL